MPKFSPKEAKRAAKTQRQLFGPEELGLTYEQILEFLRTSPLFTQMMQQNALGANALRTNTAASLGRAGGTASGIGALGSAAAGSAASQGAVNTLGQLGQQAYGGALENVAGRQAALPGFSEAFQRSSFGEQLLGGLGGVLTSIAPFLAGPLGGALSSLLGSGGAAAGAATAGIPPVAARSPGAYMRSIGGQRYP